MYQTQISHLQDSDKVFSILVVLDSIFEFSKAELLFQKVGFNNELNHYFAINKILYVDLFCLQGKITFSSKY